MKAFLLILSVLAFTGVIWHYYRAKKRGYVAISYTVVVRALAILNVAMPVGLFAHNEIIRSIALVVWLVSLGAVGAALHIYIRAEEEKRDIAEFFNEWQEQQDAQQDDDTAF